MRQWRDVISLSGYQKAVMDKARRRFPLMKGQWSPEEDRLHTIGVELALYHMIPKDSEFQLDARIRALRELSRLAFQYLSDFEVDLNLAAQRYRGRYNAKTGKWKGGDQKSQLGWWETGNPMKQSLERNILTLAHRSLRKAEYLGLLKAFYGKGGTGANWKTAQEFLDYIGRPQEKWDDGFTGSFIGLSPKLRLEQLDPAHRSDYEVHDEFSCGKAFEDWSKDPRREEVPFFLWLENSPVCLEDDKGKLKTHPVPMLSANQRRTDARFKLRLVTIYGGLWMQELGGLSGKLEVCSTRGYQSDTAKDPRNPKQFGDNVAAFVWSAQQNEFFIAQHVPGGFHHSSFESGGRVRCAGMIVIEQGIVRALSNNSGHYKPRKEYLRNFIVHLQMFGGIADDAAVTCNRGKGKDIWKGSAAEFIHWMRVQSSLIENTAKIGGHRG